MCGYCMLWLEETPLFGCIDPAKRTLRFYFRTADAGEFSGDRTINHHLQNSFIRIAASTTFLQFCQVFIPSPSPASCLLLKLFWMSTDNFCMWKLPCSWRSLVPQLGVHYKSGIYFRTVSPDDLC